MIVLLLINKINLNKIWFYGRANVAAAAGGIIFFCLYLPYSFMVVWEEFLDPSAKIATVSNSSASFDLPVLFYINISLVPDLQCCIWFWLLLLLALWRIRHRGSVGQCMGLSTPRRLFLHGRLHGNVTHRCCHIWYFDMVSILLLNNHFGWKHINT